MPAFVVHGKDAINLSESLNNKFKKYGPVLFFLRFWTEIFEVNLNTVGNKLVNLSSPNITFQEKLCQKDYLLRNSIFDFFIKLPLWFETLWPGPPPTKNRQKQIPENRTLRCILFSVQVRVWAPADQNWNKQIARLTWMEQTTT